MSNKKEFNLPQVFTLWLAKSKQGKDYLTGVTAKGDRIVGFINGMKDNPKEPDLQIKIDIEGADKLQDYTALWCNESKSGSKYFTGKLGDTKLVGFINKKATLEGKIPYITVYERLSTQKELEAEESTLPF